ncbi:EF-P 5-aminopentanol modification-associated protein YfmH [Clostridium cylindrosporum]|uniref:M16 family peptidase n=1 Tax=Clostridium cylindrosporum DSM 605 TaxID=1121307 RepID=A0A0J8D6B6_CLOCY|nr:pitrilysin family protein [Clostridium cylindrosporum]KMT21397.1 M16 family peptidase [Clostridium cylindrosporum DSM 605]
MKMKKSSIEKYYSYVTSKGLKISIVKRDNSSSFHMAMLVNFGGVDTNFITLKNKQYIKTPKGIAHFLEHKMFESKNKDTFERFSKQSASINAYTNGTATVYYFSCTDKIDENIKLFLNCLSNPYITPENVEKEKGIIIQEINMYQDNPSSKVYENLLKGMFHRNHIKYDVAGTKEDVESITFESLMTCYNTFYNCRNMELVIVGQVDPERIFSLIDSIEGFGSGDKALKIYPSEIMKVKEETIEEVMPVVDTRFLIGFKLDTKGLKGREILRKEIMYNMILEYLCGNMSPFFERLYNEAYIDSSFGYGVNLHSKFAFNVLGGVSRDPKKVLDEFYKDVYKLIGDGIEEDGFNNIKKMMLGNYTRIFDDSFSLLNNIISTKNKGGCFLEVIDIVKSIDIYDLNEALNQGFGKDRTTLSMIKPLNLK